MKSSVLAILVVLAGAIAIAQPAMANVVVGDQMYFGDYSSAKVTAYPDGSSNFEPFTTFCAEFEGTIWVNGGPGYEYEVTALASSNDASPSRDLTPKAAWLYTAYLNNALTDDRVVQYGIWHELGYTDSDLGGHFDAAVANDYATNPLYAMPDTWSGFGDVQIAQLKYVNDGTSAQDILVLVPEPATMSVLALGALLMIRRRK